MRLVLLAGILVSSISSYAAPQPRPASTPLLKQTSRDAIIRRLHSAPQRRNSGMTYPNWAQTSDQITAARYNGYVYSGVTPIGATTETSVEGCITSCFQTTNCSAGFTIFDDSLGTYDCNLYGPGGGNGLIQTDDVNSAFILNTDCASNSMNAPSNAGCCNY